MDELFRQTRAVYVNDPIESEAFTKQIAFNVIPHCDVFMDDGATREEWKMAVESRKIKRLRGFAIYLWAAMRALRAYEQPFFEVSWTDGEGHVHEAAMPMLLVSIGNTKRTGGAFYLTPEAVMDDGLLDLAYAEAKSRLGILNLLPRAMTMTGLQGQKGVRFGRLQSARIALRKPVPVHTDGEVLAHEVEKLKVAVQPGRLQVIV
jgi:diacylglycerol kinase family enzyme